MTLKPSLVKPEKRKTAGREIEPDPAHQPGAFPHAYWTVKNDRVELTSGGVVEEALVSIYVNGQELATIMCSPLDQEALAAGFLFNEGVIDSLDDVGLIKANVPRTMVDVMLRKAGFEPPRRMVLTSGCGGGISLQDLTTTQPPLETDFRTIPDVIYHRMNDLSGAARLYHAVRGVHTSILADADRLLLHAEDEGRHNTIDKIAGKALLNAIDTHNCLLLTSGRISSEMLGKARRMGIPIVASRTAPTSITLQLAAAWNLCVIGYVRRGSMRVYTHPYRLGLPETSQSGD